MTAPPDPGTQLARRRDQVLASVLSYKESHIDDYLPADLRARMRKVILDGVNSLFNEAITLLDGASNDAAIELLSAKVDLLISAMVADGGS